MKERILPTHPVALIFITFGIIHFVSVFKTVNNLLKGVYLCFIQKDFHTFVMIYFVFVFQLETTVFIMSMVDGLGSMLQSGSVFLLCEGNEDDGSSMVDGRASD